MRPALLSCALLEALATDSLEEVLKFTPFTIALILFHNPSTTQPHTNRTAIMGGNANCPADYSDDDFDFDEYFTRSYQPLSNLPTPPPSSRNTSAAQSPKTLLRNGGLLESALLGESEPIPRLLASRHSDRFVFLTPCKQARQFILSILCPHGLR